MYRINKPLLSKLSAALVLLLIFGCYQNAYAQKTKKGYKWDAPFKIPDAVKPQFANQDAVILDENIEFTVNPRAQAFTAVREAVLFQSTNITRTYQIKFLTQKGVDDFTKISLPEEFKNEMPDYNGAASRQLKFNKLKYANCEIMAFSARVQKADNKVKNVVVKSSQETINYFKLGQKERYTQYNYELTDIAVGDVVEVTYRIYFNNFLGYNIDPNFDMVDKMAQSSGFYHWWQYYFHSNIAKQKMALTVKWPYDYRLEWFYNNGADPTEIISEKKLRGLKWEFEDLLPVEHSANNKAYKHLPNVYFYVHNLNYGKWQESKLIEYESYGWGLICHDALGFDVDNKMTFQLMNAKERAINKIYKALKQVHQEPITQIMSLQNNVSSFFDFKSDANYYYGSNESINKLGAQIENKILCEEGRFEIYKGIFNRMGIDYYEAYIIDKRFGEIDKDIPILPHNAIKAMAVKLADNQFIFMLPKVDKKGYWFQELPFYLENSTALLIWQNTDSYFNDDNIYFLKTPFGEAQENARNVSAQIKIDLQNGNADFNTTQLLNGQFSTVLRNFISHGQTDGTINAKYYNLLFNYGSNIKKIKENLPLVDRQEFPYTCKKQEQFELPNLAKSKNGKTFTVQLDKMFNYFIPEMVDANGKLPFYFDFLLTERYNFMFVFDDAVELIEQEATEYNGEIEGVNYLFKIKQMDENTIKVESIFSVNQEEVKVSDLPKLNELIKLMLANEKANFSFNKVTEGE